MNTIRKAIFLFIVALTAASLASCKSKTYTVTFQFEQNSQTFLSVDKNSTVDFSKVTIPPKANYRFIEWCTDKDTTVAFDINKKIDGDITLYAKWALLYKITFDTNNGTGSVNPIEFIENEEVTIPDTNITKNQMVLAGWSDGTNVYRAGDKVTFSQNTQLTAIWSETFELSYNAAGGEGTLPAKAYYTAYDKITIPTNLDLTKENYVLLGFNDGTTTYNLGSEYTMPSKNVILTAVWDGDYTVVYDYQIDDKENDETQYRLNTMIALPEPSSYEGHTFNGWIANGIKYHAGQTYLVTGDVTFVAEWLPITSTVTFADWDGHVISTQEVPYKQAAVAPNSVVTQVAEFTGWNKSFDSITSNLVVIAQYNYTPSALTNFQFTRFGDDYIIAAANGVSLSGNIVLPHSYKGRLVEGFNDFTAVKMGSFYNQTQIVSVTIPSSYSSLGSGTFQMCKNLSTVNFLNGSTITKIGKDLFMECESLANINIPSSVTEFGERAFYGTGFTTFDITTKIETIGLNAFFGCIKLASITVAEDNLYFSSIDDHLYNKDGTVLIRYCVANQNTSFELGSNVEEIAPYAINRSLLLENFSIASPSNLKIIGSYAFANSVNIKNISLPNTVEEIGSNIFYDTSATIVFAEGITSIPEGTFAYYQGSTITIPKSVVTIGDKAFMSSLITSVVFDANNVIKSIGEMAFYNCSLLKVFDFTILTKLEIIGAEAFDRTKIEYANFPASLRRIESIAFANSSLKAITFASGTQIEYIGYSAFRECLNLEIVNFMDNSANTDLETVIENYAFADCTALTTLVLPESLTIIGGFAFGSYYGRVMVIKSVVIPSKVTYIVSSAFNGCQEMKSLTFAGEALIGIGAYAFKYCKQLTEVVLPASVEEIGIGVFQECDSLTSITMDGQNEMILIDNNLVYDQITQTLLFGLVDSLGILDIIDGTKRIENEAFISNLNIKVVNIAPTIESIGEDSFKTCYNLHTINFPVNSVLKVIESYAFGSSPLMDATPMGLTSLNLPASVEVLHQGAFYNNPQITGQLIIPASMIRIYGYVFYQCSGITSVLIPDDSQLEVIMAYSFAKMTSVTEILINSANLKNDVLYDSSASKPLPTFGSGAFSGCKNLAKVVIKSKATTLANAAFNDTASNLKIYVPSDSLQYYKSALDWQSVSNRIYAIPE